MRISKCIRIMLWINLNYFHLNKLKCPEMWHIIELEFNGSKIHFPESTSVSEGLLNMGRKGCLLCGKANKKSYRYCSPKKKKQSSNRCLFVWSSFWHYSWYVRCVRNMCFEKMFLWLFVGIDVFRRWPFDGDVDNSGQLISWCK